MLAQLRSQRRRHPLRWHLGGVLLIKAAALYLIWLAWFSEPLTPEPRQVAETLLAPSRAVVCNDVNPCDAARP